MEGLSKSDRRRARQVALQALYEHDLVGHPVGAAVERIAHTEELPAEGLAYARTLVAGVAKHLSDIDAEISGAAPSWPLAQMARVDKNVLRLAFYEAFVDNAAAPVRVAINDAIDLAKIFGSDSSTKFVNGVLATLAERRPRQQSANE